MTCTLLAQVKQSVDGNTGGRRRQRQEAWVMERDAPWIYLVHKDSCSPSGHRKLFVDLVVLDNHCSGDERTTHSADIRWTSTQVGHMAATRR